MFCNQCGNQIPDVAQFCPYCGNLTRHAEKPAQSNSMPQANNVSHAPEPRTEQAVSQSQQIQAQPGGNDIPPQSPNGPKLEEGKLGEYIPKVTGIIGFAMLLPLALWAITKVLAFILNLLPIHSIPVLGDILYLIPRILYFLQRAFSWVILFAALALAIVLMLIALQRQFNDRQMVFIGFFASVLVFLACLFGKLRGRFYYGGAGTLLQWLMILFSAAAIILGIDLFINVFVEKKELHGKFQLGDDIQILRSMVKEKEKVNPVQYRDPAIPTYTETPEIEALESYFDGRGSELFVKRLLLGLLTSITCGLGTPYMLVNLLRWKKQHTVIEGKRQQFNGTAGQLFGLWIKWFFLSLITCGFYIPFAKVDYYKWVTKHTSYDGMQPSADGTFARSFFDGNTPEYIGYQYISGVLTAVTCGIGYPWALAMVKRWESKSTVVEGERYFFDGKGGAFLGLYLLNALLTLITCGIYAAWASCKIDRYIVSHIHVDASNIVKRR